MTRKRRTFGPDLKAKTALMAAKGYRTTAQLASDFGVHTSQVTTWKKQLMDQLPDLFTDGRKRPPVEATNENELFEQIDRLKMEVDWLKKKLPKSAEVNRNRAQRLMRLLGLEAIHPRRSTSRPAPGHTFTRIC